MGFSTWTGWCVHGPALPYRMTQAWPPLLRLSAGHVQLTQTRSSKSKKETHYLNIWPVNLIVFFLYKYFVFVYQHGLTLHVLFDAHFLTQTLLHGHSIFLSNLTPAVRKHAAGGTLINPFYQPRLVGYPGYLQGPAFLNILLNILVDQGLQKWSNFF